MQNSSGARAVEHSGCASPFTATARARRLAWVRAYLWQLHSLRLVHRLVHPRPLSSPRGVTARRSLEEGCQPRAYLAEPRAERGGLPG